MSDKLSYYLYFCDCFQCIVWYRQRGTVTVPNLFFLLYGWWIFCEQLPKERFAKPIRSFNFCMDCVRMNKDCFFPFDL